VHSSQTRKLLLYAKEQSGLIDVSYPNVRLDGYFIIRKPQLGEARLLMVIRQSQLSVTSM